MQTEEKNLSFGPRTLARTACNAVMYVRATKECHRGEGVTLPKSAEERTEFVYMIKDTARAGNEIVSAYFMVAFRSM